MAQYNDNPRHSCRRLFSPETHIKGNCVKHYFSKKPFEEISVAEFKSTFDVWSMLEDAAVLDTEISTAGCTIVGCRVENKRDVADAVVSSDALKDVLFKGDSLHNIMHEKKAVASQVIQSVVVRCADDSCKLEYGDIVYVYDEYECEVRVRRWTKSCLCQRPVAPYRPVRQVGTW